MIRKTIVFTAFLAALLVSDRLALAQAFGPAGPDASGGRTLMLARMRESERRKNVRNYVEKIRGGQIPGLAAVAGEGQAGPCSVATCRAYISAGVELPNGTVVSEDRLLTPTEVSILAGNTPTADTLKLMGDAYGTAQDFFAENGNEMLGSDGMGGLAIDFFGNPSELTDQKVRADIDSSSPDAPDGADTPWLNPFRMAGAGGYFIDSAAEAVDEAESSLSDSSNDMLAEAYEKDLMLRHARFVGTETVDGHETSRIEIELPPDVNATMVADGGESFTPSVATVWVRPDSYVIAKHRVDGIVTAEGERREFFIENHRSDFRDVPGSDMYEPFRRTMRMGGVMTEEQQAQLREAQAQLAEFEEQLAAMPAGQRQMMENMMGGQMETLRNMADGGALEYVEEIEHIYVNADFAELFSTGFDMAEVTGGGNLVQQIQIDLKTLGYEPGNVAGELDTMTQVAISQFQAEKNLAVTGQPSDELARALRVAISQL